MKSKQPADEHGFPRTYRVDARTRHAVNFLLFALTGLFLSIPVLQLARPLKPFPWRSIIPLYICWGLLLVWLGSGYNKRVILYSDAIEVVGWSYSRKLNFAEIRGRRGAGGWPRGGYVYVFVPLDKSKRQLALIPFLHTDQFFRDWIKTIPKIPR